MKVFEDFDLTNYNSYRVKASCKCAFFPETESDVVKIFKSHNDFILLGNGNNVILSKPYYEQNFVIFSGNYDAIDLEEDNNIIVAESGATTLQVSEFAEQSSLTGCEFYYDIPSSIGGAIVMNAGTKEGETRNILHKVRYFDLKVNSIEERLSNQLELDYRNSLFQRKKDKVILKAWFKLKRGDKKEIKKLMNESKIRRWSKQPRDYPNCGSVFKRPPGRFVGPMIEELGLKGLTIGGAQISKKHSGFIINFNNATGNDIISLINIIKQKVLNEFNVELKLEQKII